MPDNGFDNIGTIEGLDKAVTREKEGFLCITAIDMVTEAAVAAPAGIIEPALAPDHPFIIHAYKQAQGRLQVCFYIFLHILEIPEANDLIDACCHQPFAACREIQDPGGMSK